MSEKEMVEEIEIQSQEESEIGVNIIRGWMDEGEDFMPEPDPQALQEIDELWETMHGQESGENLNKEESLNEGTSK